MNNGGSSIIVVALIMLVAFMPVIAVAEITPGEAKWRYSCAGFVKALGVTEDGKTVFILDSQGYLYVLDSDGKERVVRRLAGVASDIRGRPIFLVPPESKQAIVAEPGDNGEFLYSLDNKGGRAWAVFVPGVIIAIDTSSDGHYVAAAYRAASLPGGVVKVTIKLLKDGNHIQSWVVTLVNAADLSNFRITVSSDGEVALYNPSKKSIDIYTKDGALVNSYPVSSTPETLKISKGGDMLVYCSGQGSCSIIKINPQGGGPAWSVNTSGSLVAFTPSIDTLAVYNNNTVLLYGADGNLKAEILTRKPVFMALDNRGRYVAVGSDYTVSLYTSGGREVLESITLSRISLGVISGNGKAVVVADSMGRVYYYLNPQEEKLSTIVEILALGAIFMIGLLGLIRYLNRPRKSVEEEEEEIFPPQ